MGKYKPYGSSLSQVYGGFTEGYIEGDMWVKREDDKHIKSSFKDFLFNDPSSLMAIKFTLYFILVIWMRNKEVAYFFEDFKLVIDILSTQFQFFVRVSMLALNLSVIFIAERILKSIFFLFERR